MNLESLLPFAQRAAQAAQKVILEVYQSNDFQAELKGDQSPLTLADRRAHEVIVAHLADTGLPILSEEGKNIPYADRSLWPYFWMVDPLDGTKEFLQRNGDFTVNIALIHHQQPVLGVVGVPVTGDVYFAARGAGAHVVRGGDTKLLKKRESVNLRQRGIKVVASRSHLSTETKEFIDGLVDPELVSRGSSLKFLMVAEGIADVYPRFAPTMEWDTAAAHAILLEQGIAVSQYPGEEPLQYNKPDLLNPWFLVKP